MKPTDLYAQPGRCQSYCGRGLFRPSRCLTVVAAVMICTGQTCISPDPSDDVQGSHPGDPIDPAGSIEVIAGPTGDREVNEESQCWLDGRFRTGLGTLVYSWGQTTREMVELSENDQPLVSFIAPPPSGETEVLKSQLVVQLIADTEDSGRVIVKSADDTLRIVAGGNDLEAYGLTGKNDNCPNASSPDQTDADGDGVGDAYGSVLQALARNIILHSDNTYVFQRSTNGGAVGGDDTAATYVFPTPLADALPAGRTHNRQSRCNTVNQGLALGASDSSKGSSLEWDFGDGETNRGWVGNITCICPNTYTVRLTRIVTWPAPCGSVVLLSSTNVSYVPDRRPQYGTSRAKQIGGSLKLGRIGE